MFYQICIILLTLLLDNNPKLPEIKNTPTTSIIFRSEDHGASWDDVSAGLPQKFDAWSIHASNDEILLGYEQGLFRTDVVTPSILWQKEKLLKENINTIFSGPKGQYAVSFGNGVFQKKSGSEVWSPVFTTLEEKTILSILESKNGHIYVGCTSGILRSTDDGNTWEKVCHGEMITSLVEVDHILMGSSNKGIVRSEDNGKQWELVFTEDGQTNSLHLMNGQCFAISKGISCKVENMENNMPEVNTIRKSDDGGKTWQPVFKNLAPFHYMFSMDENQSAERIIRDVAIKDNIIYCSIEKGVYRSADNGNTWELVFPTSENSIFELAITQHAIYAIKVFRGC